MQNMRKGGLRCLKTRPVGCNEHKTSQMYLLSMQEYEKERMNLHERR